MQIFDPSITISFSHFLHGTILGTLALNTGVLLGFVKFSFKYYRKYKNAVMMFIEEHETLIEEYNRRHPELLSSDERKFSRIIPLPVRRSKLSKTLHKRLTHADDDETNDNGEVNGH